MLKVYHVPQTRSVRVVWLLGELAIPHEVVAMPFDHAVMHAPAYLAISPLGKVPCLDDDGFRLGESGAIVQYVLERYGEGRLEGDPRPAPGSPERARLLYWMHFAEGTMMPPLGILARQNRLAPADRDAAQMAEAGARAARFLAHVEHELGAGPFILGKAFTAADVMLGYSVFVADLFGVPLDGLPGVRAYLDRIEQRPAFRIAAAAAA